MSQLNVLSTENVSTYKKFKLDDGNLYMDNEKVGIETFGAGKNIIIKDNIIDICQNIDLSNVNVVNYVQIGENTFLYGDGIRKSILTGNLDICGSLTTNQFIAVNQNYGSNNSFDTIYLSNIENSVNMNTITISSEFIDASNSSVSSITLIANTLDVSNTTEINGILDVSTIFFRSGIDATNINICGDVIFNEDISFNHDVFINGNVDISNVDICNNAIIKYDISVEHMIVYGNLTINGTLDTSDNIFDSDDIGTSVKFEKIQILNLDLSGTTTLTFKDLSYIDASNGSLKNVTDISIQNLELSNTIYVKENIIVDGSFNFRDYIGNYSSISGEIILSNHLDISNSGSGPALDIYHGVDDDIVTIKNIDGTVFKIDVSGNSDFYKNVDVSSLNIENNTNIQGNVFIHQNLNISNDLVIEGTKHNLEKIDISNNVNIYGNVDISYDYKTNPVDGNKNYFSLDIDGSGLEINIQTTITDTDVSFRTITTYSYADTNLDVSNISLITYDSENNPSNIDFSDTTIIITDFSGSYTEIKIGDTTISAESFSDICANISIEYTITNSVNRYQIDICNQDNNNYSYNFHLSFNISTTSSPTIEVNNNNTTTTTYSSDISNITLVDYNELGNYTGTTYYADNTTIIIEEQQAGTTIDISNGDRTIALNSFTDICTNITKEYIIYISLDRYQIDICNQQSDNDGKKYHLSFTTSRESGPIIDNCYNTLTTYEYSNEFHSNVDISINSTIDNPYCFSGPGTMPMSGIIMWSGSELPDGWAYCDGENGTPDLRGRFIMGSTYSDTAIEIGQETGSYNMDQSGGLQRVTLEDEEMPSHSHLIESTTDFSHNHIIDNTDETATTSTHSSQHSHSIEDSSIEVSSDITYDFLTFGGSFSIAPVKYTDNNDTTDQGGEHSHEVEILHQHNIQQSSASSHTHTMDMSGGQGSHENLPPYYVLAFYYAYSLRIIYFI